MIKPTVGSLFAGVGGFDLGLERAGFDIKWQIEINPFCQRVLKKHWPDARLFASVKTVNLDDLERVDVLCGGFPCQPVSISGARRGSNDDRWLWPDFGRFIRILRPGYVFIENTPGLYTIENGELFRGILKDLADCGYDAEWDCISAAKFGAPHKRERVWIIAYSNTEHGEELRRDCTVLPEVIDTGCFVRWSDASRVARADDGVSYRVDRNKALGNACVPQITEYIGRLILEHMEKTKYGLYTKSRENGRSKDLSEVGA